MAGADKYDDDEYVAKLLAEDARKSSLRYASDGLSALMPKRPAGSAPKPNTRFLRNLVREADSHNAALKKKEELEARIRLREIRQREKDKDSGDRHGNDRKRRRLNSSHENSGQSNREGRKRQRSPSPSQPRRNNVHTSESHRYKRGNSEYRLRKASDDTCEHESRRFETSMAHGRSRETYSDRDSDKVEKLNNHRKRSSRERSPDQNGDQDAKRRHQKHRKSGLRYDDTRGISPRKRSHARSKADSECLSTQQGPEHKSHSSSRSKQKLPSSDLGSSSESDPLENLIGPLPPSSQGGESMRHQIRGRGAHRHNDHSTKPGSASNIDKHFSSTYDPKQDLSSSDHSDTEAAVKIPTSRQKGYRSDKSKDDDEDWEMALEALRDRRKWQQKQSDRMREAGWSDEEIQKWERNGLTTNARPSGHSAARENEGDVSSVRWIKKGEGREWDRGKPNI